MRRLTIVLAFTAALTGGVVVGARLRSAAAEWAPLRPRPDDACRATAVQLRVQRRDAQLAEQAARAATAAARDDRERAERDTLVLKRQIAEQQVRIRALSPSTSTDPGPW